jgi:hypothetical protein
VRAAKGLSAEYFHRSCTKTTRDGIDRKQEPACSKTSTRRTWFEELCGWRTSAGRARGRGPGSAASRRKQVAATTSTTTTTSATTNTTSTIIVLTSTSTSTACTTYFYQTSPDGGRRYDFVEFGGEHGVVIQALAKLTQNALCLLAAGLANIVACKRYIEY